MKTFLQTIGMAVVLFFYGYLLSTAGHDHAAHQHEGSHPAVEQQDEGLKHDHDDHSHHELH